MSDRPNEPSADPTQGRAPACAHLAGKSMYYQLIDGRPTHEPRDPSLALLQDGGTWWCIKSLTRLGPDAEPVGHAFCDRTRSCYEPEPPRLGVS